MGKALSFTSEAQTRTHACTRACWQRDKDPSRTKWKPGKSGSGTPNHRKTRARRERRRPPPGHGGAWASPDSKVRCACAGRFNRTKKKFCCCCLPAYHGIGSRPPPTAARALEGQWTEDSTERPTGHSPRTPSCCFNGAAVGGVVVVGEVGRSPSALPFPDTAPPHQPPPPNNHHVGNKEIRPHAEAHAA